MKKRRSKGVILFALALIALYVVIYLVPGVPGLFTKTYVAEFGELEVFDQVEGFFVKTEKVYLALDDGNVRRLVDEDTLLRVGTPAVEVSFGERPEISEDLQKAKDRLGGNGLVSSGYGVLEGGIVSFYFDGYEGALDIDKAMNSGFSYFDSLPKDGVLKLSGDGVAKDFPVFKTIKNDLWYLVIYIPKDHLNRYWEGKTVYLSIPAREDSNEEVEMQVHWAVEEGDQGKVILSSRNYLPGLGSLRRTDVIVETSKTTGLMIQKESLTEIDGEEGVYIVDKTGREVFYPVNILDENDTTVVVSASSFYDEDGNYKYTIDPFDDVMVEPLEGGQDSSEE